MAYENSRRRAGEIDTNYDGMMKNVAFGIAALFSFLEGVVTYFVSTSVSSSSEAQSISLILNLVFLLPLLLWLNDDMRQYPNVQLGFLRFLVIFVGIIGMPIYLFRTRGPRDGFLATVIFLGIVGVSYGLTYAGGWLTQQIVRQT
jgi:hypothetical protein